MKLEKKIFIGGTLHLETGMRIGGSALGMGIGGADSPVIRDPLTNIPYVPGSSLKGKMRALYEKLYDKHAEKNPGSPCDCGKCEVCEIFGAGANVSLSPSRLIVHDAFMDEKSVLKLNESMNTDMPYTEVKTEVVLDRISSKANPRQIERVPAGTDFHYEMVLDIYKGDDETKYLNVIDECLRLVEDDYLGGSGTRGYGKISFRDKHLSYKDKSVYEGDNRAKEMEV